ncbi:MULTISPECIES: helix-turn-helix domain-containing protein [Clostridium]|uniref:XRE family transcriptional regulator n=1 Tax=Clostridium botulinum TaxID=1491 RepID=A0AAU8YUK2_CLOBO|nr:MULTISPECIES: helix-turn-helix transcriptional regulator [Clostridium]AVP63907.1 XRE family transcriptional regulator [Clostridium botulinum]EHN14099.1 hypothetical protein IYC_16513 [Clostridium sporogenes PA 3679]MBA4507911.1 helix-turn-helix transcriptional regulator [Clostridium sporogenes]MBO0555318.1 XRE family transcriptional regulator [Clostridium botulinum]MCW6061480.1 helix-turn-helix transcriptional regulator [Clostridium sporogenes]
MIQENKIIIGKILRESREKKNITQEKLSKKVGISRSYLSDLENGRYSPSSEKLLLLAKFLDLDINSLINKIKN